MLRCVPWRLRVDGDTVRGRPAGCLLAWLGSNGLPRHLPVTPAAGDYGVLFFSPEDLDTSCPSLFR